MFSFLVTLRVGFGKGSLQAGSTGKGGISKFDLVVGADWADLGSIWLELTDWLDVLGEGVDSFVPRLKLTDLLDVVGEGEDTFIPRLDLADWLDVVGEGVDTFVPRLKLANWLDVVGGGVATFVVRLKFKNWFDGEIGSILCDMTGGVESSEDNLGYEGDGSG